MSVKNMLPIIGVGSAAALIGLAASRRSASSRAASSKPPPLRQRPSGVAPRAHEEGSRHETLSELEELEAPHELPQGFWDATPESVSRPDELAASSAVRAPDSNDGDGLTAEWLARATEAPALDHATLEEQDDPAEIPADSLSMISDASRYAARAYDEDDEAPSERK